VDRPYLLNEQPVEVETTVTVIFLLTSRGNSHRRDGARHLSSTNRATENEVGKMRSGRPVAEASGRLGL